MAIQIQTLDSPIVGRNKKGGILVGEQHRKWARARYIVLDKGFAFAGRYALDFGSAVSVGSQECARCVYSDAINRLLVSEGACWSLLKRGGVIDECVTSRCEDSDVYSCGQY